MARQYSSVASEKELSSGIDDSTQSVPLNNVTGLPGTFPYTLVIDHNTASEEIVTVTAAAGTTLTVTRGEDGTVGLSHESGAKVVHAATARDLQESRDHEELTSDVHGTGAGNDVVGTGTTQTLENKTVDGGNNTLQNVPQSAITDLVSDQATQDSDISDNAGDISSLTSSLSNHEAATNVHGVSTVAGLSEAQTLTNKTIDGDNNTLRDIDQGSIKRGVLNLEGEGTDFNVGNGSERLRTTFHTATNVGGFGNSGTSAERQVPFTGMYLATQSARVLGNSSNEEFELRIRRGGTSGNVDGSIISRAGGNFNSGGTPEGFCTQVEVIGPISAGDSIKFTIYNSSGATITDDGHPDWKYAGLIYLGPV